MDNGYKDTRNDEKGDKNRVHRSIPFLFIGVEVENNEFIEATGMKFPPATVATLQWLVDRILKLNKPRAALREARISRGKKRSPVPGYSNPGIPTRRLTAAPNINTDGKLEAKNTVPMSRPEKTPVVS